MEKISDLKVASSRGPVDNFKPLLDPVEKYQLADLLLEEELGFELKWLTVNLGFGWLSRAESLYTMSRMCSYGPIYPILTSDKFFSESVVYQ